MTGTAYQLMKNDEPIAIGSMSHCLDVFYREIYYGYDHLAYNIVPFRQDEEVYRKAKAFDHIKVIYDKNMNEMSISDAECIEMIGNELECADDER